jgi:hypothetical protein
MRVVLRREVDDPNLVNDYGPCRLSIIGDREGSPARGIRISRTRLVELLPMGSNWK